MRSRNIGVVASLSAIPPEALGALFKTSPDVFRNIPKSKERVVIARKPTIMPADGSSKNG